MKFKHLSLLALINFLLMPGALLAQRQMENLGRGVVALHSATSQAYVSWRLLVTDPTDIGFNLYRSANGAAGLKLNTFVITNTTDFLDTTANFTISNAWYVRPVINGVEQAPSAPYGLAANSPVRQYIALPLVNPGAYGPYDVKFAWFGDFDGDGEYDYLVDRMSDTTGGVNQFLQAYRRDGTFLWQMDMGFNSTNTANAYEPDAAAISIGDKDNVTVYDLDGDGKAEVIVRTANGTIFANSSQVVTNNNTVQFLSILDGLTGAEKARAIIPNPYFADGPLNMHAGIAYLDGIRPSVIFSGENRVGSAEFQRLTVAWDYRNGQLTQRWIYQAPANQNDSEGHQLRVADVNHDGKDDLIRIGSIITELTNGIPTTLYSTELVHGDRYHVTDIDPERPGLEMFAIQQYNSTLLATALQDLGSGALFKKWYAGSVVDVGRGITLDMTPSYRGCEMYSTQPGVFDRKGTQIYANNLWAPEAIWWDADVLREFEDGAGSGALSPVINKFNPASGGADRIYTLYSEDGGCHQAYGGRAAVWGDLFGDWREEFMVVANDFNSVRIYTTKIQATNRIYSLMQNPTYRAQCTYRGYYQASYVDYYLGHDMPAIPIPPVSNAQLVWRGNDGNVWDANATFSWFTNNLWVSNNMSTTFSSGKTVLFDASGSNNTAITISGNLAPGALRVHSPKNYTFDSTVGSLTGTMELTKGGAGRLTLNGTNSYTGKTLVSEGILLVNGSLPNSPITARGGVWLDGRLGGSGVVGGTVRIEEGAGFSPGAGTNSAGTLTIGNNVTLTGRTLSDFDLSDNPGGVNDLVAITGNLTLLGTNSLIIRKLNPTLPAGVYPLITYSGALSGSLNNLAVSGLPGVPLALTNLPGQIALVVKGYRAPATINWTGGSGGNLWDLLTTSNFLNGAAKDQFAPGDTVRFDNIGTSNLTVNLSGNLNAAAVIVDSTANYTLAGSGGIIGSASLSKSNTGTLTITALNNSYTGKTTIAGGTVVVSELDAAGYPSPLGSANASPTNLVLAGNATLRVTGESYSDRGLTLSAGTNAIDVFNAADQVTIAGLLTGSGALQKLGVGTLALSRSNNFTGVTIISAGTLSLGGDEANQYGFGANGTGTVILNGGTINMYDNSGSYNSCSWTLNVPTGASGTLNADSRVDYYGALTGGGTLTFRVPYVRTTLFGNWSAFTGQINVTTDSDGGDFRVSNSSGYANASINLAANVYAYHTTSSSTINVGALSGATGSVLSGGAWNIGSKNTDTTFAGNITGTSLTKSGTGTWTLTGTNSYSGTTTVSGGTLMVNGNGSPAKGNVTINASGTLAGTGSLGGAVTVTGKLAPGANGIGTLTCTNNVTFNGSGTAVIEINKTAGTRDLLDVGGTLTYGGTLQVTNLSGTLAGGDSFKIFDAASYGNTFASYNLPPLASGLAWDLSALPTSGTISVVVTNIPGPKALVWKGDGTANAWDINTTANWLDTNNAAAFFANFDSVTISDAGSNNVPLVLNGLVQPATVIVNATKNFILTGNGGIGGTNALTKSGTGNFTLATTNSYTGPTFISAGTLTVANPGAGLNNRWSFNNSLADSVGGQTATVVEVGANNATLSATQITLAGGAQASSDYVDLGDHVLPNVTTPVTIELWTTPLSIQNWSRIFDFGSATTENLFMSWTRGTTLTQDRVEWVDTAGTTTSNDTCQPYALGVEFHIAMVIEPGAGVSGTTRVTWYRAASTNSTLGAARGSFDTTNTLVSLNDTNCWLGRSQWPDSTANASYNEVRIWNRALSAADLQALHTSGPDAVFGAGLPSVTAVNLSGATAKLDLQNSAQSVASLAGVTGSEVKLTTASLTVGSDNSSTSFAGFFSGTNGFTKVGAGTLTLTGNSTHTGATTVSGGTLLVHGNNSAATGPLTVTSGTVLGGNGTLGGATVISSGAILAPGASIGALTFTNTLALAGTTVMEISRAPLTNDVVNNTGTLNFGGALVVTNLSGTLAAGDSFKLFNASSYTGAFSSLTLPTLANGLAWTTNTLNTTGTISVTSAVSTTPTNLIFTVTGNSLALSWPASHLGWTLQAQTNALSTGLIGAWYPVAGSTTTNLMTFPINPANPAVFYRLTYP